MKRGLFVVVLLLLSFSVFANVSTPSTLVNDISNFFSGLFSGDANIEDAYFISFVLYFILFLAIYTEGLMRVNIFGKRNKLSKQGKVFAMAAAALSTVALYIVDVSSGVSTAEKIEKLMAAFGIWGAIALAAILSFITYRFIRDSELVEDDNILIAMAFAGAIAVTLVGLLLGLDNLTGWGFLAILVVLLIGMAMHYSAKSPDEVASRRAAREADITEAEDDYRGRRDGRRRRHHVSHPLSALVEALNASEELDHQLQRGRAAGRREDAHRRSEHYHHELNEHLNHAWRYLRRLRRHDHAMFDRMAAECQHAYRLAEDIRIPRHDGDDWDDRTREIHEDIYGDHGIRAIIGHLIQQLQRYRDHGEVEEGGLGRRERRGGGAEAAAEEAAEEAREEAEEAAEEAREEAEEAAREEAGGEEGPEDRRVNAARLRRIRRPRRR